MALASDAAVIAVAGDVKISKALPAAFYAVAAADMIVAAVAVSLQHCSDRCCSH